jgi:hypothetical protein
LTAENDGLRGWRKKRRRLFRYSFASYHSAYNAIVIHISGMTTVMFSHLSKRYPTSCARSCGVSTGSSRGVGLCNNSRSISNSDGPCGHKINHHAADWNGISIRGLGTGFQEYWLSEFTIVSAKLHINMGSIDIGSGMKTVGD